MYPINLIIPFGVQLFCFIRSLEVEFVITNQPDEASKENIKKHPLAFATLTGICQLSSGVLELISMLRSSHKKQNHSKSTNTLLSKEIKLVQKTKESKIYLMIIAVAIMNLITMTCYNIMQDSLGSTGIQLEIRVLQIVFTGILCLWLLSTHFHRHQVAAMLIVVIGLILVNIPDFRTWFISYIILLASYFISGLEEVIEKIIMESKYVSPYRLLFFEGAVQVITGSLIEMVLLLVNPVSCFERSIVEFFTLVYQTRVVLYILLFILGESGLNILMRLTNFYFSPTHRSVSDTLSSLLWWGYALNYIDSTKKDATSVALNVTGYVLMMFGCLLYNELIIIYVFGCEKNTKQEVAKRSDEEKKAFESLAQDLIKEDEE